MRTLYSKTDHSGVPRAEGRRWTAQAVPDATRRSSSLFRRGSLVGVTPDARRGSVLLDNRAPHATTALKVCAASARGLMRCTAAVQTTDMLVCCRAFECPGPPISNPSFLPCPAPCCVLGTVFDRSTLTASFCPCFTEPSALT